MDREVDKELADRRRRREDRDVEDEARMAPHEGIGLGKAALLEKRDTGEEDREEVRSSHHLDRRHLVLLVELALPVDREGVEEEVAAHEDHPGHGRLMALHAHAVVTVDEEKEEADGDHEPGHVLEERVCLVHDQSAHEHDGNDLRRLCQDLDRETDVL